MNVSFHFAWFDLWMGVFYNQQKRVIYICPLPTVVVRIALKDEERGKFP
jgi:hypothetical protein